MNRHEKFAADLCASQRSRLANFDRAGRRLSSSLIMEATQRSHAIDVHAHRFTLEQKQNALARWNGGERIQEVAASIGCAVATIHRWSAEQERGGYNQRPKANACPRCAELTAMLRLALASMNGTPELHAAVKSMANATLGSAAPAAQTEGQL